MCTRRIRSDSSSSSPSRPPGSWTVSSPVRVSGYRPGSEPVSWPTSQTCTCTSPGRKYPTTRSSSVSTSDSAAARRTTRSASVRALRESGSICRCDSSSSGTPTGKEPAPTIPVPIRHSCGSGPVLSISLQASCCGSQPSTSPARPGACSAIRAARRWGPEPSGSCGVSHSSNAASRSAATRATAAASRGFASTPCNRGSARAASSPSWRSHDSTMVSACSCAAVSVSRAADPRTAPIAAWNASNAALIRSRRARRPRLTAARRCRRRRPRRC